jgi:transposase-like protein
MMTCPHCQGNATQELERRTNLGYRLFRCRPCRRTFNERTGTPFNHLQVPTEVVLLVVLWRLRYKLSLRDLAEMFLTRGFTFSHEAVREWEARFAPLLTARLRAKRRGKAGHKWHADETYVRVDGRWCYLYRAIDADGNLVDSMLSQTRDMAAAKRFFERARLVAGHVPEKVTTDGHDAYPRAVREVLGAGVVQRCSRYLNNRMEQDHRGIKQRYYPMRGFGSFVAAARFCSAHDELREHLRTRHRLNEAVSLAERRRRFQGQWDEARALLQAA